MDQKESMELYNIDIMGCTPALVTRRQHNSGEK